MRYRQYQPSQRQLAGESTHVLNVLKNYIHIYRLQAAKIPISQYDGGFRCVSDSDPDLIKVNEWRRAINSLMARTISVIGERTIPVEWATEDRGIAYTNGETVFISLPWFARTIMPSILDGNIHGTTRHWTDLKGIFYHELSHVLYTPRQTHRPTKDLRDNSAAFKIYNILEDQRIEGLFSAKYTPAKKLFTGMILTHILNTKPSYRLSDDDQDALAFLLVHGRRYLPQHIRDTYRGRFENWLKQGGTSVKSSDLTDLIDEYRLLVFPSDANRALEIVHTFLGIMNQLNFDNDQIESHWDNSSSGHEGQKNGNADGLADQRKDRDRLADDDDINSDDSDSDADDDDDDDDDDNATDGFGDVKVPGDLEPTDDDVDSEGGIDGEGPDSDDSDDSDGSDDSGDSDSNSSDRNDSLQQDIQDVLDGLDKAFQREAQDTMRSAKSIVDKMDGSNVPRINDVRGLKKNTVAPWMKGAANQVQEKVNQIFSDCDERWIRGTSTGRLNVNDVMNSRQRHFDVFDTWEDSDDEATSFEVVILLDRSDSMQTFKYNPDQQDFSAVSRATSAAQALWILQKAFAQLEIPVTVIGYANDASMVSAKGTPVSNVDFSTLPSTGSTNPAQALSWAKSIFASSDAKNRLLISLTDGEWFMMDQISTPLNEMRGAGVQTLMVLVDTEVENVIRDHGLYNFHQEAVSFTAETLRRLPQEVGQRIARLAASYTTV